MLEQGYDVLNVDTLTYAGYLPSLTAVDGQRNYRFLHANICDRPAMEQAIGGFRPDRIIHLAAESHVDRSITGAGDFIQTNVVGTFTLLEAARTFWSSKERGRQTRFHHVSTDEVFGSLSDTDPPFDETTAYAPNSPYSASKAGSDHLVRAYHHTYGLPVTITNCSNNYGPYQHAEKFIPTVIRSAIAEKPIPIYGAGQNVRDWLYVEDHARALYTVVTQGQVGETYNIGGHNEKRNIEVVRAICQLLEELAPAKPAGLARYSDLITYVKDRPGHDLRYAIDAAKIQRELGWTPQETFESGLRKTVQWYLTQQEWCRRVQDGSYQRERLGMA